MARGVTSRSEQRSGAKALDRAARDLSAVIEAPVEGEGVTRALSRIGVRLSNRMKKLLSTPGRGRIYARRGAGGGRDARGRFRGKGSTHQASAPGDPPAPDTGALRQRVAWVLGHDRQGDFVAVGVNDDKAKMLEFGTRRMRPRPFVRKAFVDELQAIQQQAAAGIVESQRAAIAKLPRTIDV